MSRPCNSRLVAYRLHKSPAKEEETMNAQMKRVGNAIRQSKFLVAPALIIGGWLALFGAVATEMSQPPLKASIEKVLTAPASRPDFLARR